MTTQPPPFTGTARERDLILTAVPDEAPARPEGTRRILVTSLNVRDGQTRDGHASIPYANLALDETGRRTGAYEAVFDNDVERFGLESLRDFDAVVLNNTCGVLFEDAELRRSLLEFVSGGKGLAGFHAAAATFCQYPRYDQWPAFGEMLGGYENGGHPWGPDETITIRVEDRHSPINAAFDGETFDIQDEVFQFKDHYSRQNLRVLLRIDPDRTDTGPDRRILPERREDMDLAMSWIRRQGQGRVFYSSFGHNPRMFWDGRILRHFLAGIQYALGDLQADDAPRPLPQG